MDHKELLKSTLGGAGLQLRNTLKDFPIGDWDSRVNEHAMSVRELIVHLSDCCTAYLAHAEGKEYDWGSYKMPTDVPEEMLELQYSLDHLRIHFHYKHLLDMYSYFLEGEHH